MIVRALPDVGGKFGIKDIGKVLVAPMQPERGTELNRSRSRKQRRSCTGDEFIRPAAERIELPAQQPICSCRAPDVLAAVFIPTRVSVWHATGVPDMILLEANRIHALGKKTTTVRIDKPEHPVALIDTKKAASAETVIGNSTPSGSSQDDAPRCRPTKAYLSQRLLENF